MTAELKGIHAKTFQDLDVIKDVIKLDEEKIAELEKENKELVDENEALKFAARMSEKTEKQLRKENKDLADCNSRLLSQAAAATKRVVALEKENAEQKSQIEKLKADLNEAIEDANRWEETETFSVLNRIYNDNFEVITSVSN